MWISLTKSSHHCTYFNEYNLLDSCVVSKHKENIEKIDYVRLNKNDNEKY